jgi:hypothetical protein
LEVTSKYISYKSKSARGFLKKGKHRMNKLILVLMLFFVTKEAGSYNTENGVLIDGLLSWTETRKLSWEDFKGEPKEHTPYSAACNWQIDYHYKYDLSSGNVELTFNVQSYFNQMNSWSKKSEETEALLSHEQLHFDIAEVHARELRKRFSERKFDKSNFKQEISKVFREVLDDCHKIQKQYDNETEHGLNDSLQTKWSNDVSYFLERSKDFAKNKETL